MLIAAQAVKKLWVANHLRIQAFGWQEKDAEIRGFGWIEVLAGNIFGKTLDGGQKGFPIKVNLVLIPFLIGLFQAVIVSQWKLRVDGQVNIVISRLTWHLNGILDPLAGARYRGKFPFVLVGCQNVFNNLTQLQLAHNPSGLGIGEDLIEGANIAGHILHLA